MTEDIQQSIANYQQKLNHEDVIPGIYYRRNHVFYPLVCYINMITGLYMSGNYRAIPLFINRAYEHLKNFAQDNETYTHLVLEYLSLMTRFVVSSDNVEDWKKRELIPVALHSSSDAIKANQQTVAQFLNGALIQAADGEPEWVKDLLAADADPNGMPLMMAIQCNELSIVEMMIRAGADVNFDFAGTTPLVRAIDGTHTEIVKVLIDAGADVNKHTANEITPLKAALQSGKINAAEQEKADIIQMLKMAGAKE